VDAYLFCSLVLFSIISSINTRMVGVKLSGQANLQPLSKIKDSS
jgi:hypothetical protein